MAAVIGPSSPRCVVDRLDNYRFLLLLTPMCIWGYGLVQWQ